MTILTHAEEVQISRDTIATVLAGALHVHGSHKEFAQRAGISPVFISNIIKGKRMPSPDMAARMTPLLPLSPADRLAWRSLVEYHHHSSRKLCQTAAVAVREDAAAVVQDVKACRLSTFSSDPAAVQRGWERALHIGKAIAPHLSPAHAPLYLDLCDVLFEANSMLRRHVDALWAVKRKCWTIALMEEGVLEPDVPINRDAFDMHKVNAMRQEMVVLTELGLCRQAMGLATEIEVEPAYLRNATFWKSALTWDRLNAMQHLPRASLHEARRMAQEAWRVSEKLDDDWQPLARLLVARSYANLCLSRDHAHEARTVLESHLNTLDQVPYCGTFHKVMLLRTWARALSIEAEWDAWQATIRQAQTLAQQAGLLNELAGIERDCSEQAHSLPPHFHP
jgi:transcriptional regulator with XRE-family HTH domain